LRRNSCQLQRTMPRKRLKTSERRMQILEKAGIAFAQYGPEATRVKDIAELCGINESLIYQHFPSKEDLYFEAMQHLNEKMVAEWIDIAKNAQNSYEALRLIYHHRLAEVYEHRYLPAAAMYAYLASITDERMKIASIDTFLQAQKLIEELVVKGQNEGIVRKDLNPSSVAAWIRSYPLFVDLAVILGVDDALPLETAREHLENLLETLRVQPSKQTEPPVKKAKPPVTKSKPTAKKSK
jgi:AcrR family transcriptional regulator